MKIASLVSHYIDPLQASAHLERQVADLGWRPEGALLTTALIANPAPLVGSLHSALNVPLIGTRTTGVASHASADQYSTALLVVVGECEVKTGLLREVGGSRLPEFTQSHEDMNGKLCFAFPDGLHASSDAVLGALRDVVGNTPVFGGLSADDWTFDGAMQFHNGETLVNSAPFMVLNGDFEFTYTHGNGATPLSAGRFAIASQGRIVTRIGDRSAYDFYMDAVGDCALFGEFPLTYEVGVGRIQCRSPLGCDPKAGTVKFGADVPDGALVTLGSLTKDRIRQSTRRTVEQAIADFQAEPSFGLVISCAARLRRLSAQGLDERSEVAKAMKMPYAMFYVYGEIAPSPVGRSTLENNEVIAIAIGAKRRES